MKKLKLLKVSVLVIASVLLLTGIYHSGIVDAWQPKKELSIATLYANTNSERVKVGLKPLALNENLNKSASVKCTDMIEKSYWAHTSPDGRNSWDFIKPYTEYKATGENLAIGNLSSESAVRNWMNSKTHREAILNTSYTDVGFAICGQHVVQHFITK